MPFFLTTHMNADSFRRPYCPAERGLAVAMKDKSDTLRLRYLLALLAALVVADGLISEFLIRNGLARETNPFLKAIIGSSAFIPIKTAGAIAAAFMLWHLHTHWPRLAIVATICFVALYSAIVMWNVVVYFIT